MGNSAPCSFTWKVQPSPTDTPLSKPSAPAGGSEHPQMSPYSTLPSHPCQQSAGVFLKDGVNHAARLLEPSNKLPLFSE